MCARNDKTGAVTLVAGQLVDDGIRLVADTLLSNDSERRSGYLAGALKLVACHRGLCVGYAGAAADALSAIRELPVQADTDFELDEIRASLLRAHRASGRATDFLIASLTPTPGLCRVTGGEVIDTTAAWVGDPAAASLYQRTRASDEIALSSSEAVGHRMATALEALIEDESLETVGGFCVRVATDADGFVYLAETKAVQGNVGDVIVGPGESVDLPMGGTAEGAFRYTIDPPIQRGLGALRIYLQPGNLGLLLYPRRTLYAIAFRNVTQDEFECAVRDTYDLTFHRFGRLDRI